MTAPARTRPQLVEESREVTREALELLRPRLPEGAAVLDRLRQERPAKPTVVVVGETGRGKSSLVNALLNAPGLSPVDPGVATATYLVFRHAAVTAARALLPGSEQAVDVPLDQLPAWATGQPPGGHPPPRAVEVDCTRPRGDRSRR